jgi:predicted nucleic acid-binding protein
MDKFYIDSCIWLNLWKKEGNVKKGKPYWKIAKEFIDKTDNEQLNYSGFVLKEIKFKLDNEHIFQEKLRFLKKSRFKYIKSTEEDYSFARKLEIKINYQISFFDCLHISICKRLNLILITRDSELIDIAKEYIKVYKPEELIP